MSAPGSDSGRPLAWHRYIPALPAALAVLAAGGAFQRVFTWHRLPAPLAVSALLGAAAGVAARELLAPRRARPDETLGAVRDLYGASQHTTNVTAHNRRSHALFRARGTGTRGETATGTAPTAVTAAVTAGALIVGATLVSAVLAAAVFASPTARPLGTAISQGLGALVDGWSRILTTSVPVPPAANCLPLAAGLVALAAGWAVVAATRERPGVGALAPAALVLVVGLLLGVHGPGSLAAVAGPPLVLAAAYLLLVSRPAGEGRVWVPPGRVLAATFTAGVVLALSLAAGDRLPLATLRQPVDLRAVVSPPLQLANTADPLDELPAWHRESRTVMFTASVDQTWLSEPTNWRLVSLDTFDGSGWSTGAEATRAGNVLSLPSGVSPALLGPVVHVAVHLKALSGPWVPTAGLPTGVAPADLDFDSGTSILVRPEGATNEVFDLAGRLPEPSLGALNGAGIGSGVSVAALTAVPSCFPASLRTLASRATAGLQRPDQLAVAVEQELATRGGFRFDTAATPGSSCARLDALAKDRSGTAEQFATAFALMARSLGLPSRIAVGFTPGTINPALKQTVVTGADVTVWPEVALGSLGWVAFDPVPSATGHQSSTKPTTVPAAQRGLAQVRQSVAKAQSTPTTVPTSTHTGPVHPATRGGTGFPWPWLIPAALVAAGGALLLVRIVARRRRRARRRAASEPAGRVLGAWAEVLDSLAPFRMPLRGLTPSEVSKQAERVVPAAGTPSRQLATLVDEAVYGGVADDGVVSQAWACSDLTVRAVAEALPPRQRIGALLVGSRRGRVG